jgi:DNA-directed RNA polymerase I subunit RPA43
MAASREQHKEHKHSSDKKKRKRDEQHQRGSRSKKQRSSGLEPQNHQSQGLKTGGNGCPFYLQKSSLYLPVSPISYSYPLQGVCAEHLSPLILTYYPPFRGVIISYSNPVLSENPPQDGNIDKGPVLAKSVDEYAASFVWVTADFLVFKPQRNQWIKGWVNLQSEGHIGLICWNLFNASIERKRLPKEWKWVGGKSKKKAGSEKGAVEEGGGEADGYYVDRNGRRINGLVEFKVKGCETVRGRDKGFLSIVGTLLGDDEPNTRTSQ